MDLILGALKIVSTGNRAMYSGTTLPPYELLTLLTGICMEWGGGGGGCWITIDPSRRGGGECAFINGTSLHQLKPRCTRLNLAAPAQISLHPLKPRCTRSNLAAPAQSSLHPPLKPRCTRSNLAAPAHASLHPLKPRCTRSILAAPAQTSLHPHKISQNIYKRLLPPPFSARIDSTYRFALRTIRPACFGGIGFVQKNGNIAGGGGLVVRSLFFHSYFPYYVFDAHSNGSREGIFFWVFKKWRFQFGRLFFFSRIWRIATFNFWAFLVFLKLTFLFHFCFCVL